MSVHDDIKIEYKLPAQLPEDGWQTKTLDCNSDRGWATA